MTVWGVDYQPAEVDCLGDNGDPTNFLGCAWMGQHNLPLWSIVLVLIWVENCKLSQDILRSGENAVQPRGSWGLKTHLGETPRWSFQQERVEKHCDWETRGWKLMTRQHLVLTQDQGQRHMGLPGVMVGGTAPNDKTAFA